MGLREKKLKILVIRRDNIGDLVCTTPLFEALREKYPRAYIAALVNSYNSPVVAGNPYLDDFYQYTKAKHAAGKALLAIYWNRLKLLFRLRWERFDYVILASAGFSDRALALARIIKPRYTVGFASNNSEAKAINHAVTSPSGGDLHETEMVFQLLAPLKLIERPIPPVRVIPDVTVADRLGATFPPLVRNAKGPLIALHISARKPPQRWPIENFAKLAASLHNGYGARFLLFWSPGDENNPFHPGDDVKAARLLELMATLPVAQVRTEHLSELIAGLSLADAVVCSDGGAMHVAAGLGKPIVCFFGNSDARRWHPWGVPHRLLQKASRNVADISPDEAVQAFAELWLAGMAR